MSGPFSRSHSPSATLSHSGTSGRRSLPPIENAANGSSSHHELEKDVNNNSNEFDGWGRNDDLVAGGSSLLHIPMGSSAPASTDFHEAMLKNDIDFAFDFSLDSLNQSSNCPQSDGAHHEEDDIQEDELSSSSARDQAQSGSASGNASRRSSRQGTAGADGSGTRRSASLLDGNARSSSSSFASGNELDGVFDGVDDVDESNETVKDSSRRRRSSTVKAAVGLANTDDVDMSNDDNAEEVDGQEDDTSAKDVGGGSMSSHALEEELLDRALNTTLCPAAAKFMDGSKPSRLLLKRLTSASGLSFPRLSQQQMSQGSSGGNVSSHGPLTPLLRPAAISRANSHDVLTTPVPLAELPSIPLETGHRDSFLFYHLTSEADPPGSPLNINLSKESERRAEDDDFDRASASSAASSSNSSLLTPVVKAEEDLEELEEMVSTDASRPHLSRSCSTASGLSAIEAESNDSFNAEMIYRIGSQGEMEQQHHREQEQLLSRSQSSSRTTSLSPRDSFSPQIIGPHEMDADWALTPPSEEEHVDEEEKDLDRATMLGLESVGMDDLDDVWPGARRSLDIQQQVDGVTTEFKILEVFEPTLPAAPIPESEMPTPVVSSRNRPEEGIADSEETTMQIDLTPMDEHTAATMFIADESLHPPKPSSEVTPELREQQQQQQHDQVERPSLSPVSAATEQVTQSATSSSAVTSMPSATNTTTSSSPDTAETTIIAVPSTSSPEHSLPQPVEPSTQSFLFHPEKPFYPDIAILLTETKILFYSTVHYCVNNGRPLLRRVENDAVDAEALLIALEGAAGDAEEGRLEALEKIRALSNTWVALDFARDLLSKYGGVNHPVS